MQSAFFNNLDQPFDYHPPTEEQRKKYEKLNSEFKALARLILDLCPACPDTVSTINKLREARMWANCSIACNS